MVRILIIEDEIIIARFIEQQLRNNFNCETRVAVSRSEAETAMAEMLPHLLLCDIQLEAELSGIHLVTNLRRRYAFEVIYITSYETRSIIEKAAATQPANYLIKPIDDSQLFAGVQLVISRLNAEDRIGKPMLPTSTLFSETELRILRLIREKKTTMEIAETLHLSRFTIKNHRHNICRKLELADENNALLKWVVQNGHLLK
ncbi:MAG TPA: DNA-binding response regulator [Puia sp.]|jgi:DNA-binding NarL/FixJ family response regulator|uniref:response regulator transcription factor n=1 Tax=Puia sp. TaxID=2045100 RepID=UPI002B6750BE|nr:DNA-binding response regulator [Puia sp.]HVU94763.1 DNA-binding response regulator [Puia sp.]